MINNNVRAVTRNNNSSFNALNGKKNQVALLDTPQSLSTFDLNELKRKEDLISHLLNNEF